MTPVNMSVPTNGSQILLELALKGPTTNIWSELGENNKSNNNLEEQKKEELIDVLLRYTEFLPTRPGKCKLHEYKFNVTDTTPIIGHSSPLLYSTRAGVRKQNWKTMEDGILELSDIIYKPLAIICENMGCK